MMENELKPCPFCGEQPKTNCVKGEHAVYCGNNAQCRATVEVCMPTIEDAIAAWNARAGGEGEPKPVNALAEVLSGFYDGRYTATDLMQMGTYIDTMMKEMGEEGKSPNIPIKTMEDAVSILMSNFLKINPPNYLSTGVNYQGEMFSVVVQRENGETPAEQNARLKEHIKYLERELAERATPAIDAGEVERLVDEYREAVLQHHTARLRYPDTLSVTAHSNRENIARASLLEYVSKGGK